jgi:hypothetical protein
VHITEQKQKSQTSVIDHHLATLMYTILRVIKLGFFLLQQSPNISRPRSQFFHGDCLPRQQQQQLRISCLNSFFLSFFVLPGFGRMTVAAKRGQLSNAIPV